MIPKLVQSRFWTRHLRVLTRPSQRLWNRPRFLCTDAPDEKASFGSYSVILAEEPFVFGVSHITPRTVPQSIARPAYAQTPASPPTCDSSAPHPLSRSGHSSSGELCEGDASGDGNGDGRIRLGGEEEARLRASAKLARKVRTFAGTLVRPGVTTNAIDAAIHDFIVAHGAYPSPLLYSGFPRSCCTSVNNVVAHGIPDDRPLEDGDIVNVDITVYLDDYHGDTSETFLVGAVDQPGRDLVSVTNAALWAGIGACGPGRSFNSIGRAIHELLRDTPYSVCSAFSGHGIGRAFHQSPWIHHTLNDEPGTMRPGHCFTIEPCIVQGSDSHVWIFPDGWTASTENCARGAQAEHMVLITERSAEVLTL